MKRYFKYNRSLENEVYIIDENFKTLYTNVPNWQHEIGRAFFKKEFAYDNFTEISLSKYIAYRLIG